jgi:alkylation response protein AidB-like acyl-CoA dehydrogenase
MTTTERGTATTAREVLDAVHRLAPAIAARAPETEAARRVPRDLLDGLVAAGAFRLLRPPSHGGLGADLPAAGDVCEALARADASVAWTVLIGSGSWIDLAGLPRAGFDELFAGAPDAITAGAFAPSGAIAADGDGYRVTGRWGFASGCEHADWIYGNCIEGIADGAPMMRIAAFAPSQVVIEDTWTTTGLRGTGSHHFHVEGVHVPAERTHRPMADPPCVDAPIVRIPPPALFALGFASVALGIARGALDDVVALAAEKVPLLDHRPLATNPTFQHALATAETELAAARALVWECAELAWETAVDAGEFTLHARARIRAAAAWATDRAAEVVRTAHRAGGGGAVYASSPLGRRLRDIDALAQHFLVRPDTLTTAGAILAGQDIDVHVF